MVPVCPLSRDLGCPAAVWEFVCISLRVLPGEWAFNIAMDFPVRLLVQKRLRVCAVHTSPLGPVWVRVGLWNAHVRQGSHHPSITTGQTVPWAPNPVFNSPLLLLAAFMIIISPTAPRGHPRPGLQEGSRSRAAQTGGHGAVYRLPGHRALYLETNSTVTSWELGKRCLGVEETVS